MEMNLKSFVSHCFYFGGPRGALFFGEPLHSHDCDHYDYYHCEALVVCDLESP